MRGCEAIIENNTIRGNTAFVEGGGLSICQGVIQNNTITQNSPRYGGGLYWCDALIQNNTIVANSAVSGGGLDWCIGTIKSCIIWANSATDAAQLWESSHPTFSCIQDRVGGGQGNIGIAPRFVKEDYRLSADSPCIGKGNNEEWMCDALDECDPNNYWQGRDCVGTIVDHYNNERLHSGINYLRPSDYYRGDPQRLLAERQRKIQ